jgi:hypothetical protein
VRVRVRVRLENEFEAQVDEPVSQVAIRLMHVRPVSSFQGVLCLFGMHRTNALLVGKGILEGGRVNVLACDVIRETAESSFAEQQIDLLQSLSVRYSSC